MRGHVEHGRGYHGVHNKNAHFSSYMHLADFFMQVVKNNLADISLLWVLSNDVLWTPVTYSIVKHTLKETGGGGGVLLHPTTSILSLRLLQAVLLFFLTMHCPRIGCSVRLYSAGRHWTPIDSNLAAFCDRRRSQNMAVFLSRSCPPWMTTHFTLYTYSQLYVFSTVARGLDWAGLYAVLLYEGCILSGGALKMFQPTRAASYEGWAFRGLHWTVVSLNAGCTLRGLHSTKTSLHVVWNLWRMFFSGAALYLHLEGLHSTRPALDGGRSLRARVRFFRRAGLYSGCTLNTQYTVPKARANFQIQQFQSDPERNMIFNNTLEKWFSHYFSLFPILSFFVL